MTEAVPAAEDQRATAWSCVLGHPLIDLEAESELVIMDGGLRLRLCRLHMTPLLLTVAGTDKEESDQEGEDMVTRNEP